MVWLDAQNLKTNYHKKMAPRQEGPFKISEVLGTTHIQIGITKHMANSQCFPCSSSYAL